MPRRKKNDTDNLTVTWVKDLPIVSRTRKAVLYTPVIEKLEASPGKLALLASGLTPNQAIARVASLKNAARRSEGKFRFPCRRAIDDGTYSVFGICEG